MWETVKTVLTSSNCITVLSFCVFFTIWFSILAKNGLLKVNFKGLKINKEDKERIIIRQQIEWSILYCNGLEPRLPHPNGYDVWHAKYVLERVLDEILTWITFNHISTNDNYIEVKQNKMINLINSMTDKPDYQTKEFREEIKKEMKFVICKLVQIRELYQ